MKFTTPFAFAILVCSVVAIPMPRDSQSSPFVSLSIYHYSFAVNLGQPWAYDAPFETDSVIEKRSWGGMSPSLYSC